MASNNSNDTGQRPHLLPPIDNTEAILVTILTELRRISDLMEALLIKTEGVLANSQTATAIKSTPTVEQPTTVQTKRPPSTFTGFPKRK